MRRPRRTPGADPRASSRYSRRSAGNARRRCSVGKRTPDRRGVPGASGPRRTLPRRQEDDAPQGEWKRDRKVAQYDVVVKVATDALTTKSKDLMITAWLTDALTRREGFAGLAYGLDLIRGLIEKFWDGVYPQIDDGDLGLRVKPLNWIGSSLDPTVKAVPSGSDPALSTTSTPESTYVPPL